VLMGAAMASETTAAATDAVGVVRRDPMAMKPFCGYNYGDYWSHWLDFAEDDGKLPKIFHVNWFRKDADGRFMWPGFGENMRVLEWIIQRCKGEAGYVETPIGRMPHKGDLNLAGIDVADDTMAALLEVDTAAWSDEMQEIGDYLDSYGDRTPAALRAERDRVAAALKDA
ncbi:MAG: phosphoenolpyruvate carboxykinase domain-containing protein, partial [Lysobacterales bacterium]|jgi:phosphoenolpyruvate carboxykinase (GTP)